MKRGGPLKRYTPLRSASGLRSTATKRAKPPQGFPPKLPEHGRMKRKAGDDPTAAEKRYHDHLKEFGCEVCAGAAEIHHILHAPETGNQRCHELVVPLCPEHHRTGPFAVHALGSEDKFDDVHGTTLLATARERRLTWFGFDWREAA